MRVAMIASFALSLRQDRFAPLELDPTNLTSRELFS